MKHTHTILAAIVLLALLGLNTMALAQTARIHHQVQQFTGNPPSMGRDFWFAFPSNEWGIQQIGTYLQIYITSPVNTTAYVESEGAITRVPITAYRTSTFNVPEFWEMESSGIVEDKAIHVYSNDADLSVYFLSHQYESGEGSAVIPSIGWGTQYVVAAYGSLYRSDGSETYDLPSECLVVANQDNTSVNITPTCDCRQCMSGNIYGDADASIEVYPANGTYNFLLNRGQCIQLMPVKATNGTDFDMSGTIVQANVPVGVIGASMYPSIPNGFSDANFVCEMIPPTRTWGETYYATNYLESPGQLEKDFARYLFISSQPNQTIFRHDCNRGDGIECNIDNQYGIYWDEQEDAIKFYSSAPFLVVSYINSNDYPDSVQGLGDPAETILPSTQQYPKSVIFQTPQSVSNITPYTNYANVVVAVADMRYTTFDNQPINGYTYKCVDDTIVEFNIPKIEPGTHVVNQDLTKDPIAQGVGVYVYGYGNKESYAWAPPSSCGSFDNPDTVAPMVDTTGACLQAYVHVADSGLLPGGIGQQTGLSMLRLDSVYNMNYLPDQDLIAGSGVDSTGYGMNVIDPTQPAILVIDIYDVAGNETKVTSTYLAEIDSIRPALNNLGVQTNGTVHKGWDTIFNTGFAPFTIKDLYLKYGNRGFTLYDSIGGPVDKSPIPPGGHRLIEIQFVANLPTPVVDSIIVGDTCFLMTAAVIGSGGANDFMVTNQTWAGVPYNPSNPTCYQKTVRIENLSESTITVDSAWWPDQVHFKAVSTFPDTISTSPASVPFTIEYCPDAGSLTTHDSTNGQWYSPQVLVGGVESPSFDNLVGWAAAPSEVFSADTVINVNCAQSGEIITGVFTLTATGTATSTINRIYQSDTTDFSLIGTLSNGTMWDPATSEQLLAPGQTATISVQCNTPANTNTTLVDYVTAVDGEGDTIGGRSLKLTVEVNYTAAVANPSLLTFGPVNSQASANNAKTFIIQNTAEAPLILTNLLLQPGGRYNAAFSLTPPVKLPDTIPIGGALTATVDFNDSISDDPVQTALLEIVGNMCDVLTETFSATIANSGVNEASPAMSPPPLGARVVPAEDGRSLEVILPASIQDPVHFALFNVLGESVSNATIGAGTQTVDASALPRGVYFYRLTAGHQSQSGKVLLGQ